MSFRHRPTHQMLGWRSLWTSGEEARPTLKQGARSLHLTNTRKDDAMTLDLHSNSGTLHCGILKKRAFGPRWRLRYQLANRSGPKGQKASVEH